MKAAIVGGPGQTPIYGDFREPVAAESEVLIEMTASALSNATRGMAMGRHYTSSGAFPLIPGMDGVGRTAAGKRVYFLKPTAPFGAMAQLCPVPERNCIEVPEEVDDVSAAVLGNPGMSAVAALSLRAKLRSGETVLVNGATGAAGTLAVQMARHLGAARVIATGRDKASLQHLLTLGADVAINLTEGEDAVTAALTEQVSSGVDVVVDYLFGSSAELLLGVIAQAASPERSLRYVHVGGMVGTSISLQGVWLRAVPISLMGSGLGSVSDADLLHSVGQVFAAASTARLVVETAETPLQEVAETWAMASARRRVVYRIG